MTVTLRSAMQFVIIFFMSCAGAQGQGVAGAKYETYLQDNLCSKTKISHCLKPTTYVATRSDGRKVKVSGVYDYFMKDSVPGVFLPHFLLTYMRNLRNAYQENPAAYGQIFYNQNDFLLSRTVERQGAQVWENIYGYAQCMEQMEYAAYYASLSSMMSELGEIKMAQFYFNVSLKMSRSLQLEVGQKTGGVRSQTFNCGSKTTRLRPCAWFHSRGLGVPGENKPYVVLNQNLHAIRDAFSTYTSLLELAVKFKMSAMTLKQVERIGDDALAGLYHLAYSPGAKRSVPGRMPNFAQFMERKFNSRTGHPYYWAFYEYDLAHGKMANISHQNTCHYHTHVLQVFGDIIMFLERPKFKALVVRLPDGWKAYEAITALMRGAGEPIGAAGSLNAVYQFFSSENDPYIKYTLNGCAALPSEVLSSNYVNLYF
ncbi:MAG: hypothetical protein AABZ31_09660 [Bdellovibrionota bacterium]